MAGRLVAMAAVWAVAAGGGVAARAHGASQVPTEKVPLVAVAGCLEEQGAGNWMLMRATEPEPSVANGPPAGQPYKGPTSGTGTFRLIGVSEYDLPAHKGHTVLVKALLIKAQPVSRLNITSVTMLSDTCK
jgi:hypothetical protein